VYSETANHFRMLERADELSQVELALRNAVAGQGCLAIVYGIAGVGRSSLLGAARELATTIGIQVLTARGSELERGYAFGVARQLLAGPVAALAPSDRVETPGSALIALGLASAHDTHERPGFDQLNALYSLTCRLAEERPVLIAVDDVQWCDRLSLDFLCYLGHRAPQVPIVVMLAWRRGEPGVRAGRLQALGGDRDTVWLAPVPLSKRAVGDVLARECGVVPDIAVVEAVHQRTGGLPFLVAEMARVMRLSSHASAAHAAGAVGSITPEPVRRDVAARLGRQPETARRIAGAVAVLGDACSIAQAMRVADVDLDKATGAVDALVRAGFLRHGDGLSFRFPLIKDATYDTLSTVERAQLHARAAELSLALGGEVDAERVATHLLSALLTVDPRHGAVLRAAARAAARRGDDHFAQRCLRRALKEGGEADERCDTLAGLGELELRLGELDAAAQHLDAACRLAAESAERDRLALGARAAIALRQLCQHQAPYALADAPLDPALAGMPAGRAMLAARSAAAVLHGRTSSANLAAVVRALLEPDGSEAGNPGPVAIYLAGRAALLVDAHGLAEQAIVWLGARSELAMAALRGQLSLARGELARADADAARVIGAVAPSGASLLAARVRSDALTVRALVALHQGRLIDARQAIDELRSPSGSGGRHPATGPLTIMIELSEPHGSNGALAEGVERPAGILAPGLSWRPVLALARLRAGEESTAAELARAHLEAARDWQVPSALGDALLTHAATRPEPERRELIGQASELLAETPADVARARALIDLGAALRRARRRTEARQKLVEGVDLAHRCGALVLAERGRAELLVAGARPRRLAFSGLDSLTASERRVAELAGSALTNRQIAQTLTVSMKTVAGQLNAVYRKLDVHDRRALAEVLANGQRHEEAAA
jgi:DNA-binding CsgD family transcriptional regulator